jgi:hypothetical protein
MKSQVMKKMETRSGRMGEREGEQEWTMRVKVM